MPASPNGTAQTGFSVHFAHVCGTQKTPDFCGKIGLAGRFFA